MNIGLYDVPSRTTIFIVQRLETMFCAYDIATLNFDLMDPKLVRRMHVTLQLFCPFGFF